MASPSEFQPIVVGFLCNWCCYGGADLAGVSRFIENGPKREISFIPKRAAQACWDCQECFTIYPTSYAQAAYMLTEALAFPGRRRTTLP